VSDASDDIVADKPKAAKRAKSAKRSASEAEVLDHQEEPEANNNTESALVVGEDVDVDEEEEEVPFDLDLAPGRTSQLPAPNMQLTGHEGVVYSCAFDTSGRVLASGSKDRCVFLWDVFGNESGECRNFNVLRGHKNAVLDVKWLPPAASGGLLTASADQVVSLWDAERGLRVRKFTEHSAIVNCCATDATNPDLVVSGSDDCTAILWDLRASSGGKGKQSGAATSMFHDYQVTAVALAGDGTTVYTGGVDNIIRKWDLRSVRGGKNHNGTNGGDPEGPVLTMRGHTDTITGLSVSPDGALLLSNSMDCSLRAWNINPFVAGIGGGMGTAAGGGSHEGQTQPPPPPQQQQQEQGTQRYERLFQGHHHGAEKNLLKCGWSSSMRGRSPSGNREDDMLFVCAGSADRVVHIWDAHTAQPAYKLPGHSGSVNEVCFHPTQPIVASCSTDRTIWLGELA
jgi:Prp8 binding protein